MTQMEIKSTIKSKRYQSHKGSNVKVVPSLLHSQIKKWMSDVTEFNIKDEKVYLSPKVDLQTGGHLL